ASGPGCGARDRDGFTGCEQPGRWSRLVPHYGGHSGGWPMAGRRRNSDYREYLRHLLRERELLQRDLALKMKRSPAWASQILNGRRKLQRHLAEEVTQVLLLDDAERWEFLRLVDLETSPVPSSPRRPVSNEDECGPSLAHWYVGAIAELARCDQYQPDPEWVAAALRPRIDVAQAREAMGLLVRLGLLDADFAVAASSEAQRWWRR
ncbi:MAG: DUF4423 domain-containing protein, partial [Myxococcota bacterium]